MPAPPTDLPTACRRAQQIGVTLMLATASYFFVARVIAAQRAPFPGFVPSLPIGVLRVVFAATAVAALLVLKIVTRQMLVAHARPVSAAHGVSVVGQRLFTLSLTRLAICQTIAVFGFVLFLLGGHCRTSTRLRSSPSARSSPTFHGCRSGRSGRGSCRPDALVSQPA